MKTVFLLIVGVLALASGIAQGQATQYSIGLYADPAHTEKTVYDITPGTLSVFVVHEADRQPAFSVSSGFRIVASPGFTGVWIGDSPAYPFEGTSPDGIALGYGACISLPIVVMETQYVTFGTSAECSYLDVVAHPVHGLVIIDCDGELRNATGEKLVINPSAGCSPIPVEHLTWGRVKALYR